VYDYDGMKFKESKAEQLTRNDFFNRLSRKDTVYAENIYSGKMEQMVIEMETELSDIIGLRFFEDWYMDYANMSIYKRVKGIVLLTEKKDEMTGVIKGAGPVNNTYIKLNPMY